jgi:hypothetical protein
MEYELSKKYKQVKVNFTPKVYERLSQIADEKGVTKAQLIRAFLSTKIDDVRQPKQKRIHKTADPKLLYHLNKIGINLNQISKHLNEGNTLEFQVLVELTNIETSLKEFL